ncbi:MAG: BACON domain-containing carbohydrate-binding protein [Vicinamibacterales bacterium]
MAVAHATVSEATTVSLTADKVAPQPVGTTIRWAASAGGGGAPYSFKWWIYDGTAWKVLRDWSTSMQYDWSPSTANSGYRIGVWVRSAGKSADVDEANEGAYFAIVQPMASVPGASGRVSAVTLVADKPTPQPSGATITWTAQATGGTAPLSYKWWLWDGATWSVLRDWGAAATYPWSPTLTSSAYRIGVWAKSAGNSADADEANQGASFTVTAAVASISATAVTLAADRTSPQPVGSSVIFSATPVGGAAPHAFKWWLYDGAQWVVLRDWGPASTYAWTPTTVGSAFRLGVWVKSAGNTGQSDEANVSVPFAIGAASARVSAVTLTPDRTAPQPAGTTVRWTAAATGGVGPISYKWWIDDGLGWTVLADWSTRDVVAWTPAAPNEAYRVGVWARSATSAVDADEANLSQAFAIRGGVPDCLESVDPEVVTFGSGGGAGSVQVRAASAGCAWKATSQATWVTVSPGTTTVGAGSVSFTVGPNPDRVSRTGFVMIGAKALSITQGGVSTSSGCTYAVYPTVLDVGFGNETASIAVTAPAGCSWSASAGGFTHVAESSGAGSRTITVTIDNNTAAEARAAVLTIAGRAVTVTQAGRAANVQGCTYAVSPSEAVFDFRAASGSVQVSAPAGCGWNASALNSFVHLTGSTSGQGSGSVTFVIDTNGAPSPRSGLLLVGGEAVTLSQAASVVEPSCQFNLSATAETASHAGGSGVLSVATSPGCEWSVVSHTEWVRVIETSGPGNGSVWYRVEPNSGSERAGTLVVAGQTYTLTQAAPPVTADPNAVTWHLPPDDQRVGECAGNCGAGCGTFFNPCGGPHYWEHTVLSTPQYVGDDWEPVCTESSSWFVVRPKFVARARWTYHGLRSSKCEAHDASCRALGFLPVPADLAVCLATAGLIGLTGPNYCEDARPFDWSYEFVDVGHGAPVAYVDGGASCN